MDHKSQLDFQRFVAERSYALFRGAYALTGDQHAAEDLLQNALVKAVLHWPKIKSNEEAYVRQVMYREFISAWRWRRRRPEQLSGQVPERKSSDDHAAEVTQRITLYAAVRKLPPKQRAVLVLRYLEDLSEQQVAEVLGCSPGTVASQASRALAKLRGQFTPPIRAHGEVKEALAV